MLKQYKLNDSCSIHPDLLWKATLDYFADIARLKSFHGHFYIQEEKIYAYSTFWHLRNHPIQITNNEMAEKYVHVNEYIFSSILLNNMATELHDRCY